MKKLAKSSFSFPVSYGRKPVASYSTEPNDLSIFSLILYTVFLLLHTNVIHFVL